MRQFDRALLVVAALGILCAGPVAACACADEMPAMPCCPDDPQPSDRSQQDFQSGINAVCDPVAADTLLPGPLDFPQPANVTDELSQRLTTDPPRPTPLAQPPPYAAPPIYLVTLRLRN